MEIRDLLAQVHSDLSNGAEFVSKGDAAKGIRSTGDNAFWAVNLNEATFEEADFKVAEQALAWIRDYKGDNTFMKSLVTVASWDSISIKGSDRAAWIMQKYLTRDAARAASMPEGFGATSTHQGFVAAKGEKKCELFFRAEVASVRLYRNRYKGPGPNGEKQVVTLIDGKGNVYVYFPSTKILPLVQGQKLLVRALVTDHSEYDGVKQTVVTRCEFRPA